MKLLRTVDLAAFNPAGFMETNGWERIRIPAIAAADNGDMLVCYECRGGAGDWSATDIGMQRSSDGGITWTPTRVLVPGHGKNTVNNPCLVSAGNTVYLFFCENYRRLLYMKSTDAGVSFTAPEDLTPALKTLTSGVLYWSVLAVGPGHGLALPDGALLLPMWFAQNPGDPFAHHPSVIRVLRFENGGKLSLSAPIGDGVLTDPSECCIAILPTGELLLNIRNENPCRLRAASVSADGGNTWSAPRFVRSLPDPVCCAGICRAGEDLLFSNCVSRTRRKRLCVKKLTAGLSVREKLPISETGGYSDICYNRAYGRAFVVYENETKFLRAAGVEV